MSSIQQTPLSPALRRLIGVILLGGLLGIMNSTMVAVGLTSLAGEFDTSLSTIGWVSTGFLLAVTAAIPFTTWAVDRIGGRKLWLAGLCLFLVASLASALAWNVGSLIAFRVVQGLAAGILDPLVLVLLARAAGPDRAGHVMGLMGVVLSLGPVLGPVAGGAILQGLGWRWMFLISIAIGLVALALAVRVVPADPPTAANDRLDVLGLALVGPGFMALVLALSQSTLIPLAIGVVLLIGYGVHASRTRAPLIDLGLFRNTSFNASVAVMAFVGLGTFASLFVLPLYYQAHGYSVLAAGLLVAPFGLGGALSMPVAGRVSDRIGARNLVRGGAAAGALSALLSLGFDAGTPQAWPLLNALLMGLALGAVGAPTMGSLYRTLPPSLVPQGSSVLYMLNQLGASVGIAVVTLIVQSANDAISGIHGVYWFAIAMLGVVLVLSFALPSKESTA